MSGDRKNRISQFVVTAQQMRDIEGRIFAAGMPVAALMEKVAGLITHRIKEIFPPINSSIGILVGPGHNGGDALVVARELYFCGANVWLYCPFNKLKELTSQHLQYVQSLGIPCYQDFQELPDCNYLIDGLFGFGLEREIQQPIAQAIDYFNHWQKPIISIDIPSGLHTDTGSVLGIAIRADYTLCLGLWKLGLLQDQALDYLGKVELIDFGIPLADIEFVLGKAPQIQRITRKFALSILPLPRPLVTHKYQQGHLLLICGSRRYAGGAILTGLGARGSGVGMLSIAIPESLKPLLVAQLPEALIIGCPETATGAIAELPSDLNLHQYQAIACGPGLTTEPVNIVQQVLAVNTPLVLDADALNIVAQLGTIPTLEKRPSPTVITPHTGEFARLFPHIPGIQEAAKVSGAVVLLKGARTAIAASAEHSSIAHPGGKIWINPESTPALARGGSGDVLTGLLGGLLAQLVSQGKPLEDIVATAAWWHAQAGILAAQKRTELGVDAYNLTQFILPVLNANC
ncbi:bifunctional ADP-dependent NAD(P)H-hydrate dehydratase/NAD(P)H-hydrate epimerase [Calothrix sp. 336/3]|uniref:bifunctional ADP-dependent NAD(P)H-hydrate dehydratase/NAD(P)H-hydrate epimerase n=1 Tax=Calothrix sp. 336/3 TaxID=1337936 RepID=UPI0004E394E8|nr:bifunctional ADP-dependent NAD(P)H-hydrate dehydratase/NAD(P)H-hydrate epimerase [Calothrix sp. 336/3]AKG22810.1 NAD(P)H-hydrate epimerase [Calothrix sp. 336/3]